ncbi:hypothetical protein F441_03403 [Phytophthora nicotianae CJ01A1]|uniref:Uncharacterized protein n=1 Tax=Phytophthora nicotianae CJ01A1 TaxID=1317063 RepID=W2XLC8_PHYNI|nr:hypothetical protein F441_03403 [Phytophthora nicotianae CJ01A1]
MNNIDDYYVGLQHANKHRGEIVNSDKHDDTIFLIMQNSTYFYMYGWNSHVPLQSSQTLLELNKGDILILRGDCSFAMARGVATNTVIQVYIDTPQLVRPYY